MKRAYRWKSSDIPTVRVSVKRDRIVKVIDGESVGSLHLEAMEKFKIKFSPTVPFHEISKIRATWQHKII